MSLFLIGSNHITAHLIGVYDAVESICSLSQLNHQKSTRWTEELPRTAAEGNLWAWFPWPRLLLKQNTEMQTYTTRTHKCNSMFACYARLHSFEWLHPGFLLPCPDIYSHLILPTFFLESQLSSDIHTSPHILSDIGPCGVMLLDRPWSAEERVSGGEVR